jgi:hypothetical protein
MKTGSLLGKGFEEPPLRDWPTESISIIRSQLQYIQENRETLNSCDLLLL